MDVGDQRGPLLLHGGQPRRLPQAIALQHLRRWNLEQPALLQRRELPGIGDREEALQSAVGAGVRAVRRLAGCSTNRGPVRDLLGNALLI